MISSELDLEKEQLSRIVVDVFVEGEEVVVAVSLGGDEDSETWNFATHIHEVIQSSIEGLHSFLLNQYTNTDETATLH